MSILNDELYKIVGRNISELRKLRNLSQKEASEKVGINRATLSNIELGNQNVSLHLIYSIAKVFNSEIMSILPNLSEVTFSESGNNKLENLLKDQSIDENTKNAILKAVKPNVNDK